jgi:hypothetical protein
MLLQYCRLLEVWPGTPSYERLKRQGKGPPSHAYISLLNSEGKVVGWNPSSPDERLYMLSQIQMELRTPELCDKVLKRLDDVTKNVVSHFRVEGNAWDLVADSGGVKFIYTVMDGEPGGRVSLEIYRRALEAWRDFLADESCDDRIVEISD